MTLKVTVSATKIIRTLDGEPKGMRVSQLVKTTKLKKRTVQRRLEELERELLIRRKNKHSPYRLTDKIYGDYYLKAMFFHSQVKYRMRDRLLNSSDVKLLRSFGDKIGALVIYCMMQSLKSKSMKGDISELYTENSQLPIKDSLKLLRINKAWIEGIRLDDIFSEFCQLKMIKKGRISFMSPSFFFHFIPDLLDSLASCKLNKKTYSKLLETFEQAYPEYSKEFARTNNDVDNLVNYAYRKKKLGKA